MGRLHVFVQGGACAIAQWHNGQPEPASKFTAHRDSVALIISARVTFRPFKAIQGHWFCNYRKRVCDVLLVGHSTELGPILHRFRDIAGFLCSWPHPIPPYFWGVPVGQDRRCWSQFEHLYFRLFGREINFEVLQPMRSRYLNVTDRQTDGRTDKQPTYGHTKAKIHYISFPVASP